MFDFHLNRRKVLRLRFSNGNVSSGADSGTRFAFEGVIKLSNLLWIKLKHHVCRLSCWQEGGGRSNIVILEEHVEGVVQLVAFVLYGEGYEQGKSCLLATFHVHFLHLQNRLGSGGLQFRVGNLNLLRHISNAATGFPFAFALYAVNGQHGILSVGEGVRYVEVRFVPLYLAIGLEL